MSLTNSPFWFSSGATSAGGGGAFYPYSIDQSLRLGTSSYLQRTFTAGNSQKFTWSGWIKYRTTPVFGILEAYSGGTDFTQFTLNTNGQLGFYHIVSGVDYGGETAQRLRDFGAWYHIVFRVDTTQATAGNRVRVYVNGTQFETDPFSNYGSIPQNTNLFINTALAHNIGYNSNSSVSGNGYFSEVNFIDGTALDATSFGETLNGVWVPKAYDTADGAYGTNGFYLDFSDNSTASALGTDSSGNGNNFSVNNLATTDQVPDSPTNNFATWNTLDKYNYNPPSEGNLRALTAGNNGTQAATFAVSSGKWYFEVRNGTAGSGTLARFVGIGKEDTNITTTPYNNADNYLYYSLNGDTYSGGTSTSYGNSWQTSGDIIGVALDMDNGAIYFSKNGTWQNSATAAEIAAGTTTNAAFTGLSGTFVPIVSRTGGTSSNDPHHANFGQDSTFAGDETAGGNADNNGIGNFKYAPPSGFLALCSANLPEVTIGPNSDTQADDYFNTVLYTGDADNDVTVTNTFAADWVWLKIRESSGGTTQHFLQDIVRGFGGSKSLSSSSTGQEGFTGGAQASQNIITTSSSLQLVSADFAANSKTYVAWTWKADGTAVSNTSGSITSSVSANQDAGFSICTWTGNGVAGATIGHGLSSAPEFIIGKNRTDGGTTWAVYAKPAGNGYLELNTTAAYNSGTFGFNNTDPTSTVFTVDGNGLNTNAKNYVAYCFHSIPGYSVISKYVGNGSSDGPFVYTGFRPAFVLTKESSATSGWNLRDNKRSPENVVNEVLQADTTSAELTSGYDVDFLSNGFKLLTSLSDSNTSGQTYIYLAFAEQPFKYANAR